MHKNPKARFTPLCVALSALAITSPTQSQTVQPLGVLPELPMLSYTAIGRMQVVPPADLRDIEVASSGEQTDVFIRLFPSAGEELAEWTSLAEGFRMIVAICGMRVLDIENLVPMTTGTMYIPNLTFVQADALRSIWHGRETCSTIPQEVFPIAP